MFLRLGARAPLAAAGFALLLPAPARAAEPAAPLVDASARGDLTAVRALIGKKVDVNAPRIDGMTALHAAVHADRLDIADALLRAGAKATAVDRYGVTPLYLAAVNGNADMIRRLLDAGVDPNAVDPGGETALMTAGTYRSPVALRALLERGATVDTREPEFGQTALMIAVRESQDVGRPDPARDRCVAERPPSGARHPDRAAIDAFASNLEAALDRAAAAKPNPGTTALHRLNRTEYANAIRDLLALPIDATTLLPGDDAAEGFDNVADVLGVSPLLIQGYVSAAEKISRLAVGDPEISADKATYRIPRGLTQADHIEGLPLGTRGGMVIQHVFPLDAEYDFRIARSGAGVGQATVGGEEEIEISVNGERVYLVKEQSSRHPAGDEGGPQSIGIAVLKKSNVRGVDDLYDVLAPAWASRLCRLRVLSIPPVRATPQAGGAFSCAVPGRGEELPCAKQILKTLARRAFRQAVADSDVAMETLLTFYQNGRAQGSFETGIQHAVARVLVDPRFLYRFEREPANVAAGASYRLSDLELASRLSFFVWSSIPDDQLLDCRPGKAADPAMLERQVRRMLADPRADALAKNFATVVVSARTEEREA